MRVFCFAYFLKRDSVRVRGNLKVFYTVQNWKHLYYKNNLKYFEDNFDYLNTFYYSELFNIYRYLKILNNLINKITFKVFQSNLFK